jgi:hypothetical protein
MRTMRRHPPAPAFLLALALSAAPVAAAPASFADLADLATTAPVIVRADIEKAEKLKPDEAGAAPAGLQRQLMTARVTAALKAPSIVPQQLQYIWDGPTDARGKPVSVKGQPMLLFLRPAAGRPDQLQLVGARAQLPLTAEAESDTRALLTEVARGDVPVVTGIGSAFRVPGAVPGEAESQFFLTTANGKPISLALLTRPGQAQSLVVATGDVIDDAARPVPPRSLLWYRLACFLPATLPPAAASSDFDTVAADYADALKLIGRCERSLP